jgi:acetate kinase
MDKFVLIDDEGSEVILSIWDNKQVFDSIIDQKTSQVRRIVIPDNENWTIAINSNRVILIN